MATALLVGTTAWRSLRPLTVARVRSTTDALLLLDLVIGLVAIALSGGRHSPYVFVPMLDVLLAGFARGYLQGVAVAALASTGIVVMEAASESTELLQSAGEISVVYALAAVVAGYAHRLFVEVEERQEVAADVVTHLTEVNELLSDLHRVARTLPSSLDLGDTLTAATVRLHDLFDFTRLAVLVLEPATGSWKVEATEGLRLPSELAPEGLPAPLAEVVATRASTALAELNGDGLASGSSSGLYAPLVARDRLVGILALEDLEPDRFGTRHVRLVNGLAESLALAVDNALWFARLQALGAEGERSRIARNLHDGVGQGLAYIALELDRIGAARPDPDLVRLRDETRAILRGVRETLHQLRAEVTESNDLRMLAEAHLSRFSERTGIVTSLDAENSDERLPVLVEQELWRILQEALENVERHSSAQRVDVTWLTDGRRGRLRVEDDGCGFDLDATRTDPGRGIRTMRERANAIGGRLEIRTARGKGTSISVEVKVSR